MKGKETWMIFLCVILCEIHLLGISNLSDSNKELDIL
ncbi:hypothetical protein BVRB_7g160260 [Beta vulgaris subsp. vulgaris]|nr:hypothetical protein BVRB_7g160260 [Beta vulgaris subsp. vulgaris]